MKYNTKGRCNNCFEESIHKSDRICFVPAPSCTKPVLWQFGKICLFRYERERHGFAGLVPVLKPIMWALGEWVVLSLFFGSAVGGLPRCTKTIALLMLVLLCGLYLATVIIRFCVSEFTPMWDVVRLHGKYPSIYALAGLSVFILEHVKEGENPWSHRRSHQEDDGRESVNKNLPSAAPKGFSLLS